MTGTPCSFDAGNPSAFPYRYRSANGSTIEHGVLVPVHGGGSVCVFEEAACFADRNPQHNGKPFACCETTGALSSAAQVWYIPLIAFTIPYMMLVYYLFWKKRKQAQAQKLKGSEAEGGPEKAGSPKGGEGEEDDVVMGIDMRGMTTGWRYFLRTVYVIAIAALVVENVVMPRSIQQNLAPSDRAAQLAMASFLTPIEEVFAFLEDAMVVKVGYALACNNRNEINQLLHISVLGGLVCGLLAFLVSLALALDSTTAGALLDPSRSTNRALISQGCSLLPTTEALLAHAQVYWLVIAATWVAKFSVAGVAGFLAGIGNMLVYLVPAVVTAVVPVSLWFGLLQTAQQGGRLKPLSLLGIAYGTGPWINAIFLLGYLAWNSKLREQYGIRYLFSRGQTNSVRLWSLVKELAVEGFDLMTVDLAVQLSLTITIYVAASRNFEDTYKIAAVQAAYWTFGPAYLTGLQLIIKTTGARLLASGNYRKFIGFFTFTAGLVVAMGLAAIVAASIKRDPVAYDFGESACIFASERACATAYATIFTGRDALSNVFEAFGPTVFLNMMFQLLRAALSTTHDFRFMAKSSVAVFCLVYVPAILVARFVLDTAVAYYVVMFLPHFVLVFVFGWRMSNHVRAMVSGQPGPWTAHARGGAQSGASDLTTPLLPASINSEA